MADQVQVQPQQTQHIVEKPVPKYQKVERTFWRIMVNNFFGGIAWSLGVIVGATIIIAIAAYFIRGVNFIPIFGHFLAEILKSAQSNLQPQQTPMP